MKDACTPHIDLGNEYSLILRAPSLRQSQHSLKHCSTQVEGQQVADSNARRVSQLREETFSSAHKRQIDTMLSEAPQPLKPESVVELEDKLDILNLRMYWLQF